MVYAGPGLNSCGEGNGRWMHAAVAFALAKTPLTRDISPHHGVHPSGAEAEGLTQVRGKGTPQKTAI